MRAPHWLILAALAIPGAALAQTPGTQPGTGAAGTQPGTGAAGTQQPGTGTGTGATRPGGDVVLNPVDPIGEDDPDAVDDDPGVAGTTARDPLTGTGVDAVDDLEEDEGDDLGTDVDPIEEVDPLGEVDRIGDVNPIGDVDPIDPGIDTPDEEADDRDELEPLP